MSLPRFRVESDDPSGHRWMYGVVVCWLCAFEWFAVRPAQMADLVPCPSCRDFTGLSIETLRKAARPQ